MLDRDWSSAISALENVIARHKKQRHKAARLIPSGQARKIRRFLGLVGSLFPTYSRHNLYDKRLASLARHAH
eukprot:scaffold4547_cov105-Pinguiococcus_pyrenoidosus.AAC.1